MPGCLLSMVKKQLEGLEQKRMAFKSSWISFFPHYCDENAFWHGRITLRTERFSSLFTRLAGYQSKSYHSSTTTQCLSTTNAFDSSFILSHPTPPLSNPCAPRYPILHGFRWNRSFHDYRSRSDLRRLRPIP